MRILRIIWKVATSWQWSLAVAVFCLIGSLLALHMDWWWLFLWNVASCLWNGAGAAISYSQRSIKHPVLFEIRVDAKQKGDLQ